MTPESIAPERIMVFAIEGTRFALPLEVVERVIRAVAVTPLPGAPANVLGVINVHGEVLPVLNLRRRLGFPERELELDDQFILVRQRNRLAILIADRVEDVAELFPEARGDLDSAAPADGFIAGVLKLRSGLALVQDLETFLSLDEQERLDDALFLRDPTSPTREPLPAQ